MVRPKLLLAFLVRPMVKRGRTQYHGPRPFSQAELRFLICRLSTYRDVSTSISHSLIAQIAGEVEGVFTDFAFLPPPRDIDLMAASRIPPWVGTTTKEPPTAFHVLGISNSFVLELLNLPKLLHLSGIPLFKTERMLREDVPFIILGAPVPALPLCCMAPGRTRGGGTLWACGCRVYWRRGIFYQTISGDG